MIDRVTSLREIRKVLIRPEIFKVMSDELSVDDYTPDPTNICYRVGKGLMVYEVQGDTVEMHGALIKGDIKEGFISQIHEQWQDLKQQGFKGVFTKHPKNHIRASMMVRAAGMDKLDNDDFNLYYKVL